MLWRFGVVSVPELGPAAIEQKENADPIP